MDIIYKRLTENELDTFIQMRINQLHEEGATEEIDLVPNLEDYYNRHMADGTFVSWIAKDGDKITASDMGVKLCTDFGFKHKGNFMHYKL